MTKLYSAQANVRDFGEPYSRSDLKTNLSLDANVAPFIVNANKAKSSVLASYTWDGTTGINSRVAKYYSDAVNSVLRGGDTKTALTTVSQGVAQVLADYGIQVPQAATPL